jgi:hypothetical protein
VKDVIWRVARSSRPALGCGHRLAMHHAGHRAS